MKFKKVTVFTEDPWYALFDGGYILPEEMLENEKDIKEVRSALDIIRKFIYEAEEKGILKIE